MSASDLAKVPASAGPVVQVPDILGGVTVSYNLPGVTKRLKLDGPTLAGIFDGHHHDVERLADHGPQPGVSLSVPRHRPRGPGRQLGDHLHLHRLSELGGRRTAWTLGAARPSPGRPRPCRRRRTRVWPPASSRPRTPSATSSWPTPSRTSSPTPRSRTRPASTWCPVGSRWPPTPTRRPASSPDRLLDRQRARADQLPDLGLQLGHPAPEADQRHHRGPGGQGARLDHPHRRRPGPGRRPRLRAAASGGAEPGPDHAADGDRTERDRRCSPSEPAGRTAER